MFREIGKVVGKGAGILVGDTIGMAGKKLKSEWIQDVGEGVKQASEFSFDTAGQALDGALDAATGYVKKDSLKKEEGLEDLKSSFDKTVKGVQSVILKTAKESGAIYRGVRNQDHDQVLQGIKGIGKTIAVSTLALGALDLADGPDSSSAAAAEMEQTDIAEDGAAAASETDGTSPELTMRNADLAGQLHPETGVPFEVKTLEWNGETYDGVFPDFDELWSTQLPLNLYESSDYQQFDYANEQLLEKIHSDPVFAATFSAEELAQAEAGETPDGYVWHHHEEPGRMELVDEKTHAQTGHTGGKAIWGGGEEAR